MKETKKEPTTTEAFATAYGGIDAAESAMGTTAKTLARIAGKEALRLLERRIGAMAMALRKYRPLHPTGCSCSPCMEVDAALTAAPPVFTLEEVEREIDALGIIIPGDERQALLERLATLRR